MPTHVNDQLSTDDKKLLIVGIGASAGGLEAFKSFFSEMPCDTGLAFVLVQHLNPDHKSILTELVSRQTKMPVTEAVDGMKIRANEVFVIPPDATLTVDKEIIRLDRPAPPRQNRHPIDSFFISLADSKGEDAVGIILSGTGSDGTQGIRAIKTQGGLTLAQAGFDHVPLSGMPQSAVSTGLVDYVMPVCDMPMQLIDYARHLREVALLKDGDGTRSDMKEHLGTISALLRATIGHDFGQYKPSTLARRVQRRMQVLQIETVVDYIERLHQDPPQLDLLFREFLIGVTQFFRDPDAFEALRTKCLSKLLDAHSTGEPLRIWVPACATGEEVYSIAILIKEEMERRGIARQVQMFGTDIDDYAVATARSAFYPRAMLGLSQERIERWFVPHGDGYCPSKEIRAMCIFAVHSIIRDPPFSKLDLISCRNLMIYIDKELQDRVVKSFHYSLKPGGFLFLGLSEGVTHGSKLFDLLDKKYRVFERRNVDIPPRLEFVPSQIGAVRPLAFVSPPVASGEDRIERSARDALEKHSPAYAVIDERFDVVRFSGGTIGQYLEPVGGPPSLNLFSLLRRTLRPVVRAAVQKAFGAAQSVVEKEISIKVGGANHMISLIVEPIGDAHDKPELCVVAFKDLGVAKTVSRLRSAPLPGPDADTLERELRSAKAQLVTAVADLETANENASSVAEEYQSINEELQSSNEELETAKEEMQSVNEELQTVNAELNSKNDQLMRLNSDLQNLLDSTDIATVFLDRDLRVRGFTPTMTELFHLRTADHGRPLDEVVSRISYDNLREDVTNVLRDAKTIDHEVQIANGIGTYIMRLRPYRTLDGATDGVVITFMDISKRKQMEEVLREHAAIVEFSQDALISLTSDGIIRSWNPGAERLFGYSAPEAIGRSIEFIAGDDVAEIEKQWLLIESAKSGKIGGPVSTTHRQKDGSNVDIEISFMPIQSPEGRVTALALSARNIAERKDADKHRTLLVRELSHRVKNALGTVQAIAAQTLQIAPTPEDFITSFSARLMALAKTHDLLTRSEWQGASLQDIVELELTPYQNKLNTRWQSIGPNIVLSAKTALALGMAFHELSTNAVKHGALSTPGGRVEVRWDTSKREEGVWLRIIWTETNGPPVSRSDHEGFGVRLITEGLAYELDGQATLEFDFAGVRCIIDVPLVTPKISE